MPQDHGVGAGQVEPEVVDTVGRHGQVLAAGSAGEVGIDGEHIRLDIAGGAVVVVPGLVLAELELVVLLDGDGLRDELVAVRGGEHLQILVPAHLISGQGADHAPGAGLGVFLVRAADRDGHGEVVDLDLAFGIHVAVAAVVLGRILDGSADDHFQRGEHIAVGIAEEGEGLADVDHRGREGGTVILGGDDAADGGAVGIDQGQGVDRGHLLVEAEVEDGRRIVHGDLLLAEIDIPQHRSGGVGWIEHGQLLPDAGGAQKDEHACGYDG